MLVITILVIIVLAGAVILTVAKNNPFEQANEAVFKADLKQFSEELSLGVSSEYLSGNNAGSLITVDVTDKVNLVKYIKSLENTKYLKDDLVAIKDSKLVLLTDKIPEKDQTKLVGWAKDIGIEAVGLPVKPAIGKIYLEAGTDRVKIKVDVTNSKSGITKYTYSIKEEAGEYNTTYPNVEKQVQKGRNARAVEEAITENTFIGLKKNTKYFVKVKIEDKSGNIVEKESKESISTGEVNVPAGSVKITITPNQGSGTYTNNDLTATITYPEIAGLKCRYSYDDITWEDYTAPLTITKNITIRAIMTDMSNNESLEKPATSTVSTIDKLTPNTPTVNLNGYTANSWSKTNVTINLTATDKAETSDNAMSGITGYEYSTNAGINYTAVNNPWIISNDTTEMNILFKSIDKATNKSDATTNYTIKKDSTAPIISSVTGSNITDTSMNVTVTANDSTSGIKGYKLSKDNGATWTAEQTSNVFNLTGLTASTAYNIKAIVIDNATNEQTSTTNTIATIAPPYGYNIPYIPTGFTHTDGTWNTGYVIKDNNNGNEFVWIPVKNIADFKRTDFGSGRPFAECSETVPSNITVSVTNYGGYYIGRYEQGTGNVSKKGVNVSLSTEWNDSLTQAKAMYNSNSEIATDLIYGTMWDTACIWLETSGNKTHAELLDSTSWGNHENSTETGHGSRQTTGYSNTWKANNIYDLAGNIWEWTQEFYSSDNVVFRGGRYDDYGSLSVVNRCSSRPAFTFWRFQGSVCMSNKKILYFNTPILKCV